MNAEQLLKESKITSKLNFNFIPNFINGILNTLSSVGVALGSILFITFFFLTHELLQVALPGDEGDDRDGALVAARLETLQLGSLALDEGRVGDLGEEPEDQLVEEEDEAVVAERLRVPGDVREAEVDRDVALAEPAKTPW